MRSSVEEINFNEPKTKAPESAIKIKCRYCDLKDDCTSRLQKEKYEDANWITRCTITHNRPSKKRKTKKKKS